MTPPASAAAAQPARRVTAPPRPRTAPARPRRVSGPARPARPQESRDGLVVGVLGVAETLATHRMLDRLIRGRLWIGIVAFALIGIVTLQLSLLKLNSGIGRSLERAAALRTENAALSIENSELASGTRVELQAGRLGMQLGSISSLHFLSSHGSLDGSRAAEVLRKPLTPVSEPPGGSGTESTATVEPSAATSGGESTSGSEAATRETESRTAAGAESQAAGQEAGGSNPGGETAATSAPSAPTSTVAPTGGETSSGSGGGTAGPGG